MRGKAPVPALMVLGTGSDVGKSLLVAGLARAYSRRGLTVRPFKPQNMSNNAAVTIDGGEIGRAQALQARACYTQPVNDMNPVLLKPQSETGAQVVVQGRVVGNATARDYAKLKATLLPRVIESFGRLSSQADLILVEGAGSPAEVNLRAGDIANMGFAEAADVACILVGDIDRGGVIASIAGTHALLPDSERQRIKGYVINKFRGDVSLFSPALELIDTRTGWRSFGILPHITNLSRLPPEDGVALAQRHRGNAGTLHVVVPHLPGISNIDDIDPLAAEPGVSVSLIERGKPLPREADLILLPGSKTTIADLTVLRSEGWDIDILAHARTDGHVLGLCGGYQMLGRTIADPVGIEGPPGEVAGLGLLDIATTLTSSKRLEEIDGFETRFNAPIAGYEMHMGQSAGPDRDRPFAIVNGTRDGAMSMNGRIAGTYLHGIFGSDLWRRRFIESLGGTADPSLEHALVIEATLDGLAEACEQYLDLDALWQIAQQRSSESNF